MGTFKVIQKDEKIIKVEVTVGEKTILTRYNPSISQQDMLESIKGIIASMKTETVNIDIDEGLSYSIQEYEIEDKGEEGEEGVKQKIILLVPEVKEVTEPGKEVTEPEVLKEV